VSREKGPPATRAADSERLARALRDNLRRRKQQQALRARPEADALPPSGSADDAEPGPAGARNP
jgi:hypothetical protein